MFLSLQCDCMRFHCLFWASVPSVLSHPHSKADPWDEDSCASSLFGRWSLKTLLRSETGKGRQPMKGMLSSKWPLWTSGAQPHRGMLGNSAEQPRLFIPQIAMSYWLRGALRRWTLWHIWLPLGTGRAAVSIRIECREGEARGGTLTFTGEAFWVCVSRSACELRKERNSNRKENHAVMKAHITQFKHNVSSS